VWQWLNEKPVDTTDPLSTYFDVESKTLKAYASKVNSELSSKDMVCPSPETRNETREAQPPIPETRNLTSYTRNPNPETPNPKPKTQNPKPQNLEPKVKK
jgi:hypothetical protein